MQNNNQPIDMNFLVTALAWVSIFITSFLLILNKIPSNWMSWGFFIFFLILALFGGLSIVVEKKEKRRRM